MGPRSGWCVLPLIFACIFVPPYPHVTGYQLCNSTLMLWHLTLLLQRQFQSLSLLYWATKSMNKTMHFSNDYIVVIKNNVRFQTMQKFRVGVCSSAVRFQTVRRLLVALFWMSFFTNECIGITLSMYKLPVQTMHNWYRPYMTNKTMQGRDTNSYAWTVFDMRHAFWQPISLWVWAFETFGCLSIFLSWQFFCSLKLAAVWMFCQFK